MTPTKLTMIPHDGGPCPVGGLIIVKTCRGYICALWDQKKGVAGTRHFESRFGWLLWSEVIAYCPIEIEEETR